MQLELIGPHPLARDEQGGQLTRIGTLFLDPAILYTRPPGIHAWQRLNFIEYLNVERASKGLPKLSPEEEQRISCNSVDLVFDSDHILIRPDPERMELAFAADELLQSLVSKRQIKFLSVSDPRVVGAIRRRGECWRLSSIPKQREAKERLILGSKVAILGKPIYFYNRLTGTRWLTLQEFESLGSLSAETLAQHLQEISDHSSRCNRLSRREIDFFAADPQQFGARNFQGQTFTQCPSEELRSKYDVLKNLFRSAVPEPLRQDNSQSKPWCQRMLSALFLDGDEAQTEQILGGLSPEFFLQINWLAGGRFEEGEFLLDPIFDEVAAHPDDPELQRICDLKAKEIIFNFIRDFGDLEYINLGLVPESLSLDRPQTTGRRRVYLAEFCARDEPRPLKRFLRLQKWGVWEHLDEGKNLLQSIEESNEYTDYWLDRRLGCRQLGMNLCHRVIMRRLNEIYQGTNESHRGHLIRTTYFEREYLPGIATDKLPLDRYTLPGYAVKLAALMGRTAASGIIVGRSLKGIRPTFDDGDEVVCETDGLPETILLGDHSGAFNEYKLPLKTFAPDYARPVNAREIVVPEPSEFANAYLEAFEKQFRHIQGDYRKRRRGFDTLFKHCKYDPAGSFAYRWECVLRRLDQTDCDELVAEIRKHIKCLQAPAVDIQLSHSVAM
jgi:hypothetical protein